MVPRSADRCQGLRFTTFTKNRDRLLEAEIADRFFAAWFARPSCAVTSPASISPSTARCWRPASHKSFKPKDGPGVPAAPKGRNIEAEFHGERRSNETHCSTTDPQARLAGKSAGTPARLCYAGHLLMENRNALIVDAELTQADGYAERATAIELLGRLPGRKRRRTVEPPTRATTPRCSSPTAGTST